MGDDPYISETVVEAFVEQTLTSLKLTESIKHPGESGRAREEIIRRFLAQLLPTSVRLDSGFVIDARGGVSKQIDLIVYRDGYHPVFDVGGIKHVMVEAVVATIQNKARITSKRDLRSALDNIASVKRLDRTGNGVNRIISPPQFAQMVNPSRFEHQVLGIVIAQRSMQRDALLTELHAYLESSPRGLWPNLYVDVKEFDIAYGQVGSVTSTDQTNTHATATRINGAPLADLAYEMANFIRVSPVIDYPPSAYFGLAKGFGGIAVYRPIAAPDT